MDFQNLLKQFSSMQNLNQNTAQKDNLHNAGSPCIYPEPISLGDSKCEACDNNKNSNKYDSGNHFNANKQNPNPQNPQNGLFGQGLGNLLPLLSLFGKGGGKMDVNSMLNSTNLPPNLSQFAPIINMLSKSKSEENTNKSPFPEIDTLKKIE
jgi:hypothetical protein